jgi:hypothetical protein
MPDLDHTSPLPAMFIVSEESFNSTENGTSLSAHGARVAPSGRPLGGANLSSVILY